MYEAWREDIKIHKARKKVIEKLNKGDKLLLEPKDDGAEIREGKYIYTLEEFYPTYARFRDPYGSYECFLYQDLYAALKEMGVIS